MIGTVISVLLPLVSGSCLPDAIPPEARKNLVNPNGETYPVGLYACDWAASMAAHYLAQTLIQEVLGYNTTINEDAPGGGVVAGFYGITGCRTPNNAADRGCMQGVSYYHVHLEAWRSFQTDMAHIQQTYTSMAPINKGTMGYKGVTTMYIPRPVQQQAYSTAGKALEFFRAWNTSWNQPWNYFTTISSIDSSKLMPCSKSTMSDDAAMRRHVQYTGDADGVVVDAEDTYSGRCDDGFWWLSPSCRSNSSQCVPMLTGGSGWGMEEFMQKITVFNMPVALAVAGSWALYQSVPLSGDMAMFWWTPDPSFLALAPLQVQFPAYRAREFEQNILTSMTNGASVDTLVSSDLALLSPLVERFADRLDITLAQMDEILVDQMNTKDSWEEVTCRWIKGNEATWRKWIPDESECYPGFGLFDSVLKEFTDVRINATNKIVCEACPPGTFSQLLEDGKDGNGVTYICLPCEVGTSQASGAQMSCKPCKSGEFQDQNRSTECKRCDFGNYQDEEGQVECKTCPAGTKTLGFGSISPSDCGCEEGYIDMDPTGAYDCVKCGDGMSCPALSQLVDLEDGKSANGDAFTPKILAGFYSKMDNPTEIFRCKDAKSCPGGPLGSCGGGLIGTPCSECREGSTFTGKVCENCGVWRPFLWVLAVCGLLGFLTLAYYLTTSKVTAKASVLFATTASFGMLVMSMQNLGLVGMMTVEWPLSLQGVFSVCQFLLLDIDSYGFSCIAGQTESVRYLFSALIFPIGIAWLALCYGVSRLLPTKYRWEGPKVVSTMGAFCQVGFSTMSATALAPMMCYQHPNGLRSILKYPGVICGTSEHTTMLVTAWLLLTIFVLGFVAFCGYAVLKVPRWSALRKDHFVASVRFLVFRFRLDSWWFGVPLLVRGPLINLPVVLATDYPPIQVVIIAMILTTVMVMQMLAWPWKVPMLNATDCIVSFCIVLLVTTSTLYLNEIDDKLKGFAAGVSTAMLSGIGVAVGIMVVMTSSAIFYRSAMGGKKELAFFNLGRVPNSEELAKKVKDMAAELEKTPAQDLSSKLAALSVFDSMKITTCITLMATEVAPPAEDGKSFKFNKRIASASFDPSLKRKPQSRSTSRDDAQPESNEITNAPEPPDATAEKKNDDEDVRSTWI